MKNKKLSRREKEVLQLSNEGMTVNEIAVKLNISPKTVANHYQNMRNRFQVKKITMVAKIAIEEGWIK
jgi:DNA-binding NarL/FixJ family response regulator